MSSIRIDNILKVKNELNGLMFKRGHYKETHAEPFYYANADTANCLGFSYKHIKFKSNNDKIKEKIERDEDYKRKLDEYLLEIISKTLLKYDIDKIRMYNNLKMKPSNDYNQYEWNEKNNKYTLTESMKNNVISKWITLNVTSTIVPNNINVIIP